MVKKKTRVIFNCMILERTRDRIKALHKEMGCSQGGVLDRLVEVFDGKPVEVSRPVEEKRAELVEVMNKPVEVMENEIAGPIEVSEEEAERSKEKAREAKERLRKSRLVRGETACWHCGDDFIVPAGAKVTKPCPVCEKGKHWNSSDCPECVRAAQVREIAKKDKMAIMMGREGEIDYSVSQER